MTDSTTITLLLPEIVLIAAATLLYVVGAFVPLRATASWWAFGALALAAVCMYGQHGFLGIAPVASTTGSSDAGQAITESGPLAVDLFGYAVRWGTLAIGAVLVMLTARSRDFAQSAEEAASLLLMLAGLMLLAAANELILLFVGLELVSIPTYVLLYIGRYDARGQEAASKYFFLSILSSAILLYGFTFLYGVAGSTQLSHVAAALGNAGVPGAEVGQFSPMLMPLAMLMIFAGLAFRLTAVPFHFYAPDVYQGTSHANAALLATLPKIAGLAVIARIVIASMPGWESLGWKLALVLSVLTMTLGNILALWQNNLRRMLAYSSIAHAGYLLIGVAVALAAQTPQFRAGDSAAAQAFDGLGASVFYLAVYMFATLGTFAALVYVSTGTMPDGTPKQVDTFDDIAGLNRTHPVVALVVSGFMFSLTGIPPLAGFWGKFALLFGALTLDEAPQTADGVSLRAWFIGLAIVAALNAAISAAYYLRVIGAMYFRSPEASPVVAERKPGPALAMLVCAVLVLGVGLFPKTVVEEANRAGRSLGQAPDPPLAIKGSGVGVAKGLSVK